MARAFAVGLNVTVKRAAKDLTLCTGDSAAPLHGIVVRRLMCNFLLAGDPMGMFDEIKCKMPLPVEIDVEHREHWFQTKSLACSMDYYEIREDGSLWREAYETEDRSDPNAEGILALVGCMTRVNKRWIPCLCFTGEIAFYTQASSIGAEDVGQAHSGWIEFSTYFVGGQLKQFELLRFQEPSSC